MAAIGISEFTFGYAFLSEQTQKKWSDLKAAPILPSLQQEYDAGWDAHLPLTGTDFYYQFKLSEHLSKGNATFIADKTYAGPYYRIPLHRKHENRQHARLKAHAKVNPNTFYVSPEFNSVEEFNAAFLSRQIMNRTRLIAVRECEDVYDGKQHYITYRQGEPAWIFHSDKKRHEESVTGKELGSLYRRSKPRWASLNKEYAINIFQRAKSVIQSSFDDENLTAPSRVFPLLEFDPQERSRTEILLRVSELLSVALGLTMVLVGPTEKD
jgi:hypothetical protein